jgi:valyl-tRNA synthetase
MSEELSKIYEPKAVEEKWYKIWEENGYFKPDPKASGKPFTIVIPPPNVTGSLHMGHALNNSIQDLLVRYKRMNGFKALWIPGTDHAGIATQNVVERELKKEGKTKEDLGREKFIERVWEWKNEYGGRITSQLRRLGASCDWSRERFTMDEGLSRAVRRHFVQLYKEGLIYRGKRIINWCPRCRTALSDIEVEHEAKKGSLWYIKYGPVTVATTRPETMLGDTAVAVNPGDERYKHMWGTSLTLPLVGRKIPVINDDFVDSTFGTGAVKVTPAHDPNDYEMGMRHNLPMINILTPDGKITLAEFTPEEKSKLKDLEGLDRFEARKKIVAMLDEQGLIEKIEDHDNSVGHCYRCKTIIEPYLSDQWFVKVKPLAEKAIAAVEEGKVKFVPERWTKLYLQWMTNLRDWCISRQLWWGHRIPAWYRGEELYVGEEPPKGSGWTQDPDVFDTWFSSALWPFSTLGWPDNTEDLKTYYPTDVLVTSYDIIFFWVARMIMAGLHFMGKEPFHTVYFNALVKDVHGKKMSKSWGNVIDPLDVIDKAGADALRFAFLSLCAGQGQDIKLSEDKITEARNFANKIWNVSRFILMHVTDKNEKRIDELYLADKWILSRLNRTIEQVTKAIEEYDFGVAAKTLYDFIWGEFCDWYIEMSKIEASDKVLIQVYEETMRLLHPFMPFITEEIWQKLEIRDQRLEIGNAKHGKTIMLSKWPKADKKQIDEKIEIEMNVIKDIVRSVRNIRATLNIPHSKELTAYISADIKINDQQMKYIRSLAKLEKIEPHGAQKKIEGSATAVIPGVTIHIPLKGIIDLSKEVERLNEKVVKLDEEIAKVQQRLSAKKNVPEDVLDEWKGREREFLDQKVTLQDQIKSLTA